MNTRLFRASSQNVHINIRQQAYQFNLILSQLGLVPPYETAFSDYSVCTDRLWCTVNVLNLQYNLTEKYTVHH